MSHHQQPPPTQPTRTTNPTTTTTTTTTITTTTPLQLDSFLQKHSNQPSLALVSLINQFNSLANQLSSTKLQEQQQSIRENELKHKLKQLQDENRQLWTLISKSKSELKLLKAEQTKLTSTSNTIINTTNTNTNTTPTPTNSEFKPTRSLSTESQISPTTTPSIKPFLPTNRSSTFTLDESDYLPQREHLSIISTPYELSTPTTEELQPSSSLSSSSSSLSSSSSSVDMAKSNPQQQQKRQQHQQQQQHPNFRSLNPVIEPSTTSLGLPPTTTDQLAHNDSNLKSNHNHHNLNLNLNNSSNSSKFRLSLHPTSKQPSSKHFHRHSVLPPEAKQYFPGIFPPLPSTMSTLSMPPARSPSAFSTDTGSIPKLATTPAHKSEAIESLLLTSNDSNELAGLSELPEPPQDSESQAQQASKPDDPSNLASKHSLSASRSNLSPTHSSYPSLPNQHISSSASSSSSQHQNHHHQQQQQQQQPPHHPQQQPPTTPTPNSSFPHSAQPTAKRRMLTPTFLPFTQIKVTNSHIRANDKSKEVISFSININIIIPPESDPERKGAKASWIVEKFYSDVLTLDHLVKSKHSKTQNKALAQLPDRALFKDHAPSKVDARKAVLQKYLQSLCTAQLKDKGDVCDFFNSNILISERTSVPNRPGFMQGYLTKKGRNFGGWQTRFYVLDGPILEYFDTRGGNRLGHIVITGAQIGRQQPRPQEVNDDSYRHAFLIRMHKREKEGEVDHILCAETDEERDAWVDALTCYVTGRYVSAEPGASASAVAAAAAAAAPQSCGPSPDSTPARAAPTPTPSSYSSFSDHRTARQTSLDGTSRTDGPNPASSYSHHHSSSSDFRSEAKSSRNAHLRNDSINSTTFNPPPSISHPNENPTPTILEEPLSNPTDQRKLSSEQQQASSEPARAKSENRATLLDGRSPPNTINHSNESQKPLKQSSNQTPLTPRTNIQSRHLQQGTPGSPQQPQPQPLQQQQQQQQQETQMTGSDGESIVTSDRPMTPESQQRPKISGPMNGAPITGGYRIKPAEDKKAKFRSAFWGFAGRGGSERREPGSQPTSLGSPALFAPAPRPVFGVSLQEAVSVARVHDRLDLPAVVFRCVEFLEAKGAIEEEGIYRLSGSSVIIKGYKERFNTEGDFNLLESSKEEYHDVHAVAGLLKQFLRELASPILTRELHGEFLKVIDLSQRSDKVNELGRLCAELPLSNYTLLRFLSAHLIHVVQNEKVNKMSLRNVGIVFSPTLGMPAPLFALLLKEFDLIFNIDGDNRAPIKLPDESTDPSTNPNSSTINNAIPSGAGSGTASDLLPSHSKSTSVTSLPQKRISRNSMLYSASGADMLMEHNKLARSKENINEDTDSEVEYDSSSEPDSELIAASSTRRLQELEASKQGSKEAAGSGMTSARKTSGGEGGAGGHKKTASGGRAAGNPVTPSFSIDRFDLHLHHQPIPPPRPSIPRPVSSAVHSSSSSHGHHHHHHHHHRNTLKPSSAFLTSSLSSSSSSFDDSHLSSSNSHTLHPHLPPSPHVAPPTSTSSSTTHTTASSQNDDLTSSSISSGTGPGLTGGRPRTAN